MKPFLGLLRNLLRWTEDPRLCLRGVCMRWLAQSAERALHWWLPAHQTSQSEKPNTSALLIPYHRLVLDQGRVQSSYRETVAPGLWAQRSPGDHGQHAHAGGGLGQADPCQGMQWVASQNMQWPSTKSQAERAFCLVPQKQPQGPEWSHSSVPRMSWKETLTCGLTAPGQGNAEIHFPEYPGSTHITLQFTPAPGQTGSGRSLHSGTPESRQQGSHLSGCSHNTLSLSLI